MKNYKCLRCNARSGYDCVGCSGVDRFRLKFLVLKIDDIGETLSEEEKRYLDNIVGKIKLHREARGKATDHQYIVINRDEKYAQQVEDILRANGHWG
jgi:hypothetical protein